MAQAIRSTRVATPHGVVAACVLIEDESITAVCGWSDAPRGTALKDLADLVVLPGLFGAIGKTPAKYLTVNADPPAACGPAILDALEQSAVAAGKKHTRMVSRAYHDSLFMARIAPIAMLFIPCRGGISHRPDEYASPAWIGSGVHVLARTLALLAS